MLKIYEPRARDVQAIRVTQENMEYVSEWCNGRTYSDSKHYSLVFEVNEGENLMVAKPGDYLIKRAEGEFIKMTPKEFEEIYIERR